MSWQENEAPTKKQVIEAVKIFLNRMGLNGHQTIAAAHVNTAISMSISWSTVSIPLRKK